MAQALITQSKLLVLYTDPMSATTGTPALSMCRTPRPTELGHIPSASAFHPNAPGTRSTTRHLTKSRCVKLSFGLRTT